MRRVVASILAASLAAAVPASAGVDVQPYGVPLLGAGLRLDDGKPTTMFRLAAGLRFFTDDTPHGISIRTGASFDYLGRPNGGIALSAEVVVDWPLCATSVRIGPRASVGGFLDKQQGLFTVGAQARIPYASLGLDLMLREPIDSDSERTTTVVAHVGLEGTAGAIGWGIGTAMVLGLVYLASQESR